MLVIHTAQCRVISYHKTVDSFVFTEVDTGYNDSFEGDLQLVKIWMV